MSPKLAPVLAGVLFLVACLGFVVAGFLGDKPVFFALGTAFAAVGAVFLGKARSVKG